MECIFNFDSKCFIWFPTTIVDYEYFAPTATLYSHMSDFLLCRPKDLFNFVFIQKEILLDVSTTMTSVINKEKDISYVLFVVAIFDKIWFFCFYFLVSLQNNFFEIFKLILNDKS